MYNIRYVIYRHLIIIKGYIFSRGTKKEDGMNLETNRIKVNCSLFERSCKSRKVSVFTFFLLFNFFWETDKEYQQMRWDGCKLDERVGYKKTLFFLAKPKFDCGKICMSEQTLQRVAAEYIYRDSESTCFFQGLQIIQSLFAD